MKQLLYKQFIDRSLKYTASLISPTSGKMLKIPLNDITSLNMKATTALHIHKFSTNIYNHSPNN